MSRPRKRGKGCEIACSANLLRQDIQILGTGTNTQSLVVSGGEAPLCPLLLSDLLPNYSPSLDNCLPLLCLAASARGGREAYRKRRVSLQPSLLQLSNSLQNKLPREHKENLQILIGDEHLYWSPAFVVQPTLKYDYFGTQFRNSLISKWTEMSEMINAYKTAAELRRRASDSFIIQAIADVDDVLAVNAISGGF